MPGDASCCMLVAKAGQIHRSKRHVLTGAPRMPITRMDHFTILTTDVERTVAFYRDLLGFTPGPRPAFPFPGAWLYNGDTAVLSAIPHPPRFSPNLRPFGIFDKPEALPSIVDGGRSGPTPRRCQNHRVSSHGRCTSLIAIMNSDIRVSAPHATPSGPPARTSWPVRRPYWLLCEVTLFDRVLTMRQAERNTWQTPLPPDHPNNV